MFQGWAGWSALRTNATTSRIAASERRLALVLADDGVQHTGFGQRAHDRGVQQEQEQGGVLLADLAGIHPGLEEDGQRLHVWLVRVCVHGVDVVARIPCLSRSLLL
jgi:hypothetical protein